MNGHTVALYGKMNSKGKVKTFFKRIWEQKYLQLMALPPFVLLVVFAYLPMLGIVIAFSKYSITKPNIPGPWVGLENFKEFVTGVDFLLVMKNTVGISFFKLLVGFPLPILFALMLNELKHLRLKKAVQTISYLPHFLSWIIVGGIMINWLADTGLVTTLLLRTGIIAEPTFFLAEPRCFWGIAVLSDVWKEMGYGSIIYIAAIASIDAEQYEAAIIDGAGRFQRIWHITLPGISETIAILFILSVSHLLNSNFDQLLALSNSLNREASDVLDLFVYRTGISTGRYSYAAAIGLFRSFISLALLLAANHMSRRLTERSLF